MVKSKKALSLAMAIVMAFSFVSLAFAASYNDEGTAYTGNQGTGGNTLTMFSENSADLLFLSNDVEGNIIFNKFTNTFDSSEQISFDFTMSAGMNNFNAATFTSVNMPLINISNEAGNEPVVSGGDTDNKLTFGGFTAASESGKYNGVAYLTVNLAADALEPDTVYALSFASSFQGNNASKTLGSVIVFFFKTAAEETEPGNFFDTIIASIKAFFASIVDFINDLIAKILPLE